MGIKQNGPYIVAYELYLPDRYGFIRVSFADTDPQTTAFEETSWQRICPHFVFTNTAVRPNGTIITEAEFHNYLKEEGYRELNRGKHSSGWFHCEKEDIIAAYEHLLNKT